MPKPPARTHHPPLIRTKIVEMLAPLTVYASDPRQRAHLPTDDALAILDLLAVHAVAQHAQTILFSTTPALALKPVFERFGEDLLEYCLPNPFTLIQFSEPIADAQLLP